MRAQARTRAHTRWTSTVVSPKGNKKKEEDEPTSPTADDRVQTRSSSIRACASAETAVWLKKK
jgi:hypothetical protein